MKTLVLCLALSSAFAGALARPAIDDAVYGYTETCDRSPVPNPATGRYDSRSLTCRLADAWYYGTAPLAGYPATDACQLAAIAPTDSNIEACTGRPWYQ